MPPHKEGFIKILIKLDTSFTSVSGEMLLWGLLLAAVAGVLGEEVGDISRLNVGDKWTTVIPSKLRESNSTWTLSADEGTTIKVFCPDARFPGGDTEEERCKWSKLIFDDGVDTKSWCGTQYDFQVVSKSSKMTIEMILPEGSAAILECLAKTIHPPKSYDEITISPSGVKRFRFPEVVGNETDKAWRFQSSTDKKISLQCDIQSEREQGGVCIKDIVTVDNGNGPEKHCGYNELITISKDREITLRFETYPSTQSKLDCRVQAISGSRPNEFENVEVQEEDSFEHGVVPGKKSTTCECGKANQQAERIINGTEVSHESKYPFMVSLRTPGNWHFCGASILSPVHILTAAHCVSDSKTKSQPKPAEVVPIVGAHSKEDSSHGQTQKLKVKKISVPSQWFDGRGLAGDIALLHLETPITFSKYVSPVCLTPDEPDIINKYIKHMGWGYTEEGYPDTLREANVQVLDNGVCNRNPKEVCFRTGPTSACFGDSGGPFVFVDPETNRYTQVALASYVYKKCYGKYYIGTNTVHWYDWIKNAMAETSTEHEICRKNDLSMKPAHGTRTLYRPTLMQGQ